MAKEPRQAQPMSLPPAFCTRQQRRCKLALARAKKFNDLPFPVDDSDNVDSEWPARSNDTYEVGNVIGDTREY
jgi:hypothetical protein